MRQGRNTSYGANEFVWKRNDVESDADSIDHLERSPAGRRGRKGHQKDQDREDRWAALDRDTRRGKVRRRVEDDAYFEGGGLADKPGRRPDKRQRAVDH